MTNDYHSGVTIMNLTIKGTRIELTASFLAFVEDKLTDALRPLGDMNLDPVNLSVELELTTRRHPKERKTEQRYRAEAAAAAAATW